MGARSGVSGYQAWLYRKTEEFERASKRFRIDRSAFFMALDLLCAFCNDDEKLDVRVTKIKKAKK